MEYNFFYLNLISIPSIAFVIWVIIKWLSSIFYSWKFNIKKAISSWWMPSVHSAVVTSLTTAVALKYWVSSDLFAISLWFTVIIIYDAINIRYEAGLHAWAINKLLWEKFKESLWHLPSEAFAWSILWIIIALFLFYI